MIGKGSGYKEWQQTFSYIKKESTSGLSSVSNIGLAIKDKYETWLLQTGWQIWLRTQQQWMAPRLGAEMISDKTSWLVSIVCVSLLVVEWLW